MKKLYLCVLSFPSLARLLGVVCVVLLAMSGRFPFMWLRSSFQQAAVGHIKTEEAWPCYPPASRNDAFAGAPALREQFSQFFPPLVTQAPTARHFASLLPSLPSRAAPVTMVPAAYPTLAEFEYQFEELARKFPQLVHKQIIGASIGQQRPLWAVRLTDNPQVDEDEPAILFTALHHAREPAGVFICKAIMEELLSNYGYNTYHTRLVDSLDIWFVPLVNPDGYAYIMERQRQFPWWRKNLRDNDGDGKFDPHIDGVDLNRNYDYNWAEGGEGETGSWFYRGKSAFSEPEIQALRDLDLRRNFVIGVSFHSYGEAVLYPWGNFNPAPDQDLITDVAQNYAAQIGRLNARGSYSVLPLNGRVGQSSVWRYGTASAIDFICETGEGYFPAFTELPRIVAENARGASYLLERALRSGLTGHVRDAQTGAPLAAEIFVAGRETDYVKPRHSQNSDGRFDRLLLPGAYTVAIRKSGYRTERFENIVVHDSTRTYLQVALQRETAQPAITSH